MRKVILQCFTSAIFFILLTSCGKDVKAPDTVFASSAKTTSSATTTTTTTNSPEQNQDPSNDGCGSHSGSESSGGY